MHSLNAHTDSPSADITNWLHLSPATNSVSPFRNITCATRVNRSPTSAVLDLLFSRNCSIPEHLQPSTIATPSLQHNGLITGYKGAMLTYTPSPNNLLSNSDDQNRLPTRSPSSFNSTAFSDSTYFSQDTFMLDDPTILALEDRSQSFDDDISPVVRSQPQPLIVFHSPGPSQQNTRPDSQQEQTTFMHRLLSSSFSQRSDFEGSAQTGRNGSVLLSPMKINSPNSRMRPSSSAQYRNDDIATGDCAPPSSTLNFTPVANCGSLSPMSPLTPLPASPASPDRPPIKRKRSTSALLPLKRPRRLVLLLPHRPTTPSPLNLPITESPPRRPPAPSIPSTRTFPAAIEISPKFTLFYRRFPASSYYQPPHLESPCSLFRVRSPGGIYNRPRSPLDLYTPRFVKGKGIGKVGLCPICIEPPARGGEGRKVWLAMKVSAYKCYHMQYAHGISASTGKPFSPPTAFRTIERTQGNPTEKTEMQQGKCHKCSKWVAVEGIKNTECKVKEIFWWKHAAACHQGSTIPGESDLYEDDHVFQSVKRYSPRE